MDTALTKLVGCRYPIIAGPMFLVSEETLTAAVCKTGATATMPSLNWRNAELFRAAIQKKNSCRRRPFWSEPDREQSKSKVRRRPRDLR